MYWDYCPGIEGFRQVSSLQGPWPLDQGALFHGGILYPYTLLEDLYTTVRRQFRLTNPIAVYIAFKFRRIVKLLVPALTLLLN